ncbi:hypothetical protein NC651_029620 [Populus alba x Populus x berolinensis]|nr:hypothetical protein NC651_029620 [Populus alba x Populus x berolinensis]
MTLQTLNYVNVSCSTMPEPKIRIRIPQLLAKTMRRRSNDCITDHLDDHARAKKERVVKPKSLLPEKFGLFFPSVFGKKKSPKASSKVHKNGDGYKSDLAWADDGFCMMEISLLGLHQSLHYLFLEIEEEEEEGEEHEKPTMERRDNKPSRAADMFLKVSFSSIGFFHKESIKGTPYRSEVEDGFVPGKYYEEPKWRKTSANRGESREECGEELCKKRILMGERCKPLSFSGSLHYDEDGTLLPEVLLW